MWKVWEMKWASWTLFAMTYPLFSLFIFYNSLLYWIAIITAIPFSPLLGIVAFVYGRRSRNWFVSLAFGFSPPFLMLIYMILVTFYSPEVLSLWSFILLLSGLGFGLMGLGGSVWPSGEAFPSRNWLRMTISTGIIIVGIGIWLFGTW